jgi:hypothetical protein
MCEVTSARWGLGSTISLRHWDVRSGKVWAGALVPFFFLLSFSYLPSCDRSDRPTTPSYSFGSGKRQVKTAWGGDAGPGPGEYRAPETLGPNSKTRGPMTTLGAREKFGSHVKDSCTPGPAVYELKSSVGTQVSSRLKSSPACGFGTEERQAPSPLRNPSFFAHFILFYQTRIPPASPINVLRSHRLINSKMYLDLEATQRAVQLANKLTAGFQSIWLFFFFF